MRVAYYRGLFDPFHNGHKEIINELYKNTFFDKIEVFVDYSGKEGSVDPYFTYEQRIKMLQEELSNIYGYNDERISVSRLYSDYISTIFNPNGSTLYGFLIDNVLDLRNDEIYLVFGSDTNITEFYNYDSIINMNFIKFFIINRENSDGNLIDTVLDNSNTNKLSLSSICVKESKSNLIRNCLASLNDFTANKNIYSYCLQLKEINRNVDDHVMFNYIIPALNKDVEFYLRYKDNIDIV